MEHRGFFLIADITGYTAYLSDSELDHARQTLTDLLELVVEQTRPPFTVIQLEGDAVLSYALEEGFVTAQTFLERIEETYVEFRRAIDLMVLNNTCKCNACANVSALDLKFFVHYGSFAIQPVGDMRQLVGTDVNLVHRLLKNSVTADTGVRAYLLLTEAAADALGLESGAEGMVSHREGVPDFGEISVMVKDMHPAYEERTEVERPLYDPNDVLMALSIEIPVPLEQVWDYFNQTPFRNLAIGSDRYELEERRAGRVTSGSVYNCYHGKMVLPQVVLDWRPFQRVAFQQLIPMPGQTTHTINDYRFSPLGQGTKLEMTASKPTGPVPQRLLARLMMTMVRKKVQARMEEFRDGIVEDYSAHHHHQESGNQLFSSLIESTASNSLKEAQAGSSD